jgi:hypothetical protein
MSKLNSYLVSYQIKQNYCIEVEASSPAHAAGWAQTLPDRNGIALPGSENLHSATSVTEVIELKATP